MEPVLQMESQAFSFWMPIQKAEEHTKADGSTERRIKGIASTKDVDLQNEIVHQQGIDFKYFLRHGFFNDDHKPGFKNKVGQPTTARLIPQGLYVEGILFKNHQGADDIWELMQSLDTTPGATRKIGFSVQGKVKRRSGKHVLECWIQDVAITPAPINTNTWAEIVKSMFSDGEWSLEDQEKALAAGYSLTNQTDGNALQVESMERQKKLSKAEYVTLIQLEKGFSRYASEAIADVVFGTLSAEEN